MRKVKYADIGRRIKEARINAGYKQKDCLEPLGDITAQMLSDWENGYVCPSITYLRNLAKFYNVTLDYIILGKPMDKKDKTIRTYKDAAESMLELVKCNLFEIDHNNFERLTYTYLQTFDDTINSFREELDNLFVASKTLKPELLKQAIDDLLDKYDFPLKNKE